MVAEGACANAQFRQSIRCFHTYGMVVKTKHQTSSPARHISMSVRLKEDFCAYEIGSHTCLDFVHKMFMTDNFLTSFQY